MVREIPADPSDAIRVAVADDDAEFRSALVDSLSATPGLEVVASLPDGHATRRALAWLDADVVVLDLRMDGGGVALIHQLRHERPDCALVVVSGDDQLRPDALSAGAAAFVPKGGPTLDVSSAVRGSAVRRRGRGRSDGAP